MRKSVFFWAVVLFVPSFAFGWGQIGHRVVGEIAEREISSATKKALAQINVESLATQSTWPDEVRSDKSWDYVKTWHYVTIEDSDTYATSRKNSSGDVIAALKGMERILRDPSSTLAEKKTALRFYIHFVGDIHQPLHVGRGADMGGNSIKVKFFDSSSNLHSVWDSGLIEQKQLSFTEYATVLLRSPQAHEQKNRDVMNYEDWAVESKSYVPGLYNFNPAVPQEASARVYLNKDDAKKISKPTNLMENVLNAGRMVASTGGMPTISYGYAYVNTPIVDQRLLKAGLRLAAMLDSILGK